jgi:hypothetical protein
MYSNSIFIFNDVDEKSARYDLYLFKDFSGTDDDLKEDIINVIDDIRQRVHFPEVIYIIASDTTLLDKLKIEQRFTNKQKITYIDYEDVEDAIFKKGISSIVYENNVVQYAPKGTRFKKTSGKESDVFIKASLALSEYPKICFLVLALNQRISNEKLEKVKTFYIDTSSIISLIQGVISYRQKFKNCNTIPQIVNFQSYRKNSIDFNTEDAYTIISASTSGNLRKKNNMNINKCTTLFYPKDTECEDDVLFELTNIKKSKDESLSLKLIPLTLEDFSLEYSKAQEVIITKKKIEGLDEENVINKLLGDRFKTIEYHFKFNAIQNHEMIYLEPHFIYWVLEDSNFLKDILSRSLLSEKGNCIISDLEEIKDFRLETENIVFIKKDDFITTTQKDIENKNIIVFLTQATDKELIHLSQKLRDYKIHNITYIIGVLITDNVQQAKSVQNNICFNDTDYKYNFYCYLNLPLSKLAPDHIGEHKLSNGFVFYKGDNASELNPKQVYLVIGVLLELLRSADQLTDNTTYHDVLSPKNFSRLNDSLLQMALLRATRGRELNFQSNSELSYEMKNVILDLMKEKEDVGVEFIKALKISHIRLTQEDYLLIEQEYPELLKNEETI